MTALISSSDHSKLLTRRSIVIGAAALMICAPAIVRVTSLMPVRRLPFPFGPQSAGFVERLYLHALERSLQAALRTGRTNIVSRWHTPCPRSEPSPSSRLFSKDK
jgi:hypothetical protein